MSITQSQLETLRAASRGHRLNAREAHPLDRLGFLIREPRTGWCLVTDKGRAVLSDSLNTSGKENQ